MLGRRARARPRRAGSLSRAEADQPPDGLRDPGDVLSARAQDTDDAADAALFGLFAVVWALAALFHVEFALLFWREPAIAPKVTAALVALAATLAVWTPTPRMLAVLALAQLADVGVLMPAVPNHWLLAGGVNLALLAGVPARRDPAALLRRVRAPLMVAVAVFYLWTGVWKLNADFVRPEVSCAVASVARLLGSFPWLPDSLLVRRAVIAATLGMELVGPLLLLVPATRAGALVAFVVFHVLIGLDAVKMYLNFGSVMFGVLTLFLPAEAVRRGARMLPDGARRARRIGVLAYLAFVVVAVAVGGESPLFLLGRWLVWLGYAVALLVLALLAVIGVPRPARWLPAGAGRLEWVVPALVLANGVAPILGLKTRTSWQMYSNVRLERDVSNHLLFPPSLDVAGAMRDPVRVAESESRQFRDVVGTSLRLPWIEFRRRLALDPDARVVWERAGVTHATGPDARDPALAEPLPLAVRKLMIFRPLGPDAAARCDW